MAQVPLQNCEICEKVVGRRYCIDCEQYFCKTCEEFHLKSKSCRNHVFQDQGQINPEEKKVKCIEHKENMTYYCTTCSILVCKICLPNKHSKHDFTLTSEAALKCRKNMKKTIEEVTSFVESIGQQRTKLASETKQFQRLNEGTVQEITRKGNQLKILVDKIISRSVAIVEREEKTNLQSKIEKEGILKDAQERGEFVISKVINAIENKGDTMLLSSHQSLQQIIQSMQEKLEPDMEWSTINYYEGSLSEETLTQMIGKVKIFKKRTEKQAKETRQMTRLDDLTDTVQWHYIEEDKREKKLVAYPPDVNSLLEIALIEQCQNVSFFDQDGTKYVVDFNSYEAYTEDHPNDRVQLVRKSKPFDHALQCPLSWDTMKDTDNLKIVQLKPTDQEYRDVLNKFTATACVKVTVGKIERIQNKTLYQQFVARKKSMDSTNPTYVNNEKQLWHGFSVNALYNIITYGFNRSYCGKDATALGAGVYFAVNVNYAIQDTYARPDTQGHKRMFLCRVLTGEYCHGTHTMKVPPAKKSAAGSHILYDTVTNDVNNPIMFVIFHDSQAYPEYLVTFKRD